MPASRRALVVALACLSNFSLSCFAAAQLSDQVVRVTDSSPAADPVMGVNITLKTTLARVPENGMPVILGSSQAQVVSAQDGLASIVPSAGSVGPCEVFITVSAGQSTAQFQMESVAAIVSSPAPKNYTQSLRLHRAVGNLVRNRSCHRVCRTCCSRFHKAIQETNRRWIRTQARVRNQLRTTLVTIGEARRQPVQRARTLCLLHLQDRSRPKPNPKLRRRWCQRRATLLALPRAPMLRAKCGSNLSPVKHLAFRGQTKLQGVS
jgi:hypothetical protein